MFIYVYKESYSIGQKPVISDILVLLTTIEGDASYLNSLNVIVAVGFFGLLPIRYYLINFSFLFL